MRPGRAQAFHHLVVVLLTHVQAVGGFLSLHEEVGIGGGAVILGFLLIHSRRVL